MSKNFGSGGKGRRNLPPQGSDKNDDKRPSVFERLGVRRDGNMPLPESPGSSKWSETKSGIARERIRFDLKRRSRSSSPCHKIISPKKKPEADSRIKTKKTSSSLNQTKQPQKSQGKMKLKKDKDAIGGSKPKKKSVKKPGTDKKLKVKQSSASSEDSSDDDSGSSSSSSSSSTSTTSNNSSSSDSSVPSVKLKSDKSKSKARNQSKALDKDPKKAKKTLPKSHSSSSSSGLLSPDSNSGTKLPPNVDLREKLNARSPSTATLRDIHNKPKYGDMTKRGLNEPHFHQEVDKHAHSSKRPVLPDDYHYDDPKRRRMNSPVSDKYRQYPPDPPSHVRRVPPPSPLDMPPKRGRSPHGHPYRPEGRPRQDELMRRPGTKDDRNMPYQSHNVKPRDLDRRREIDFPRDNRQGRERLAPSRNPPESQMDYHRRMGQRNPHYNVDLPGSHKGNYDRDRRYPLPRHDDKKPERIMLPKTKEASAEHYGTAKKSGFVDKWVDETVKNVQMSNYADISKPHSMPSPIPRIEDKPKVQAVEESSKTPAIETEDLSDFSDDADEILKNPDSPASNSMATSRSTENKEKDSQDISCKTGSPAPAPRTKTSDVVPNSTPSPDKPAKIPIPEGKSLPSQSQTDDDILERMDFEEISDEELVEVENKVPIVDALGVDWASLVCQEKKESPKSDANPARKRWSALNVIKGFCLPNNLMSPSFRQKMAELEDTECDENNSEQTNVNFIEKIGLGPNSRALSSRRDMALRRWYLDLPPKSLLSLDVLHPTASSIPPQEIDTIGELYKLSINMFSAKFKDSAVKAN